MVRVCYIKGTNKAKIKEIKTGWGMLCVVQSMYPSVKLAYGDHFIYFGKTTQYF